jgi:streptothricin acetyltransferase
MLMDAAVNWGRENGLHGVSLETQDNNLFACRFYIKYGFKLGGADRRVYDAFTNREETALYFYLL